MTLLPLLLAGLVCLIITATLNWKMPKKRVIWWLLLPLAGFIVVGIIWPPLDMLESMIILIILVPLAFFAADCVQYIKNKTDPLVIRETINGAILSLIAILIAALIILSQYLHLMYLLQYIIE